MALNLSKIRNAVKLHPEIKLFYSFGSMATNNAGPMSDYDFAVYLSGKNKKAMLDLKIDLQNELSRLLKTDKVDIVILNTAESAELKFNIIKEGKLIFDREPFKVIVEPKILNEYFDFHHSLLRHRLTNA
jgi:predicted nucleotidyltransferase